jgi:hypothetical protein
MLKLPLVVLVLLGTCAAQDQHSLAPLQGSARILMVFAPNADTAEFQRQLQLIERHSFELSIRNTVVVPVSTATATGEQCAFENLPLVTAGEMADMRNRFHVQPGDFLVVLLNQDGTEQFRSASPIDIHEVVARLDAPPLH